MKRKTIGLLVLASAWVLAMPGAHAQAAASQGSQTVTEQDIKLLRQDLRSQKKQLIAANLKLTDAEATRFWPVYDQYSAEMAKIGDQKYALIKEYAQNFRSLTDEQAQSLTTRALALDEAIAQLRIKYVAIVNKVLPAGITNSTGAGTELVSKPWMRAFLVVSVDASNRDPYSDRAEVRPYSN
jgi:hypothetical protein